MRGRTLILLKILALTWLGVIAPSDNGYAATSSPEIHALENGLTIALWPRECTERFMAVHLVVDPPSSPPGSYQSGVFKTLMHAMFTGETETDDLFKFLNEKSAKADVEVSTRYGVFAFEIFPELLDSLFARIAHQWDTGITGYQFDKVQDRIHDIIVTDEVNLVERLPSLTGDTLWNWTDNRHEDFDRLFREHMGARRMSLVVVGSWANIERASAAMGPLNGIPSGDAPEHPATSYANVLRDRMRWPDEYTPWVMGLIVDPAFRMNPSQKGLFFAALERRLNETISLEKGLVYGVQGDALLTGTEHLILFKPHVDEDSSDFDLLATEIRTVAAELAETPSLEWWKTYLEARKTSDRLFGIDSNDPSAVANDLDLLVAYTRAQGSNQIQGFYLPPPEEARRRYAEMLANSRFFVIEPYSPTLFERASEWRRKALLTIWRDLFGPGDANRTVALMCHCGLLLLVLRRLDRWVQNKRVLYGSEGVTPKGSKLEVKSRTL